MVIPLFSRVLLKGKKLKWSDPVLKCQKWRNILPTLKHLPGMQMLNPVSYIADRASASAELEISQTSVCCNDFCSTLARLS